MLNVKDVSVNYGVVRALNKINFEVKAGEIVSFLGSNGAGKTTCMRMLSGLLPIASGDVFFEGVSLKKKESHEIVALGISQSPEGRLVFPDMSVHENLMMGAFTRKDPKAEILSDLDFCFEMFPRLKERRKQNAHTLSGGEQQMLAISRALMAKPKLLLLDEPSLGISPILTKLIFSQIKNLKNRSMTVLLAEQNARMSLKISDRCYVLEVGEIVASGLSETMLEDQNLQKAYLGG